MQKKKISSEKKAKKTKPTVASESGPTKKPSFSTNKRIHVTPFPESETPMRPPKIMKSDETKDKLNGDAQGGEDKASASDKLGGFSLSPFFWLREGVDEEGGTVETLSEPPSLATPLRHNAPCFSDIKGSDEGTPNTTPNVCFLNIYVFFSVQNSVLTSLAEIVLMVSYLSCRAKLWFQMSLIVKSLNGPRGLALQSCVLLHGKSRYFATCGQTLYISSLVSSL